MSINKVVTAVSMYPSFKIILFSVENVFPIQTVKVSRVYVYIKIIKHSIL